MSDKGTATVSDVVIVSESLAIEEDVQSNEVKDEEVSGSTTSSSDALVDSTERRGVNDVSTDSVDKSVNKDTSDLVFYEGDKYISVDPVTKARYVWDEANSKWLPENQETVKPDFSSSNNYQFDGTTYNYTDPVTKTSYKWDLEKNAWVSIKDAPGTNNEDTDDKTSKLPSKVNTNTSGVGNSAPGGVYGYENDMHTYTDPSDNTVYIWDREKNAWFPKVDDDFLANYQMSYGFNDPDKDNKDDDKVDVKEEKINDIKSEKRKVPPEPPSWFEMDNENNTKVYVSNLPLDITQQEFIDLMQKCGLVMKDLDNNQMKVKLYVDSESKLQKGDGLCTYIRKESVDLALNLLDGSEYRGRKLHVEKAKFTMKGNAYDPNLKPKKKRRKDKEKIKKMQEKLFDWRPDKMRGERSRNESVVIIKNLFEPSQFEKDVKLILEFQQDLREECAKCGDVKKVIIYDRNVDGVAQVNFKEPEAADACIQLLNGRWFSKRQITAETWDGKTKYRVVETEEQKKERLEKWSKYLHSEEKANNNSTQSKKNEKSEINKTENKKNKREESIEDLDSDNGTDEVM